MEQLMRSSHRERERGKREKERERERGLLDPMIIVSKAVDFDVGVFLKPGGPTLVVFCTIFSSWLPGQNPASANVTVRRVVRKFFPPEVNDSNGLVSATVAGREGPKEALWSKNCP